jgi:hypothetical protein
MLLLEINRKDAQYYSFKKAKNEITKDNHSMILGIDDRNLPVEQDDNLIIFCSDTLFMIKYILSIAMFYSLQKKIKTDNLVIIDCLNRLNDYKTSKFNIINNTIFNIR